MSWTGRATQRLAAARLHDCAATGSLARGAWLAPRRGLTYQVYRFASRHASHAKNSFAPVIDNHREFSNDSKSPRRVVSGSLWYNRRWILIWALQVLCLANVISDYICEFCKSGGASMMPTISVDGDFVLVMRLPFYRAIERFLPADVVGAEAREAHRQGKQKTSSHFGGPRGKLDPAMGTGLRVGDLITAISPNDPEKTVCKRILGMAGDTILFDPRIDPEPWHRHTWHKHRASALTREENVSEVSGRPSSSHGKDIAPQYIIVPKGHVWVGGDNLANSTDSRHYGPIPLGLVKGRVVARVFPGPTWLANTLRPLPKSPAEH